MATGHYSQAFDHSLPHAWLILEIVMMVVILVNYDDGEVIVDVYLVGFFKLPFPGFGTAHH